MSPMQLAANSQCSAFVGFPRTPKKSESASICKTCVNALLVSAVEATQHSRKEYVSNATRSQLSVLCFCYQWKQRNTPEKNMSPIQLAAKCQCSAFVTSGSNATLHQTMSPMQPAANRVCRSAVLASMLCLCWVSESPAKV